MDIATAFENQLEYDKRFINSVRENERLRQIFLSMESQIVLCILYEIWKRERQKFLGFIFVGINFARVLQSFNENPERFIKNSIYESCDIKSDEISEQPRKDYYSKFFPIVEQYKVCAISCVTELINYRKQLKDLAPEYFQNYFFGFIMNPLNAEINEKNFEVMADRLVDVAWDHMYKGVPRVVNDCNGIRGKIIKLTEKFRISQKGIKEIKDEKMASVCDFFLEKDGTGEVYPAMLVDKDKVFDYITITCNNAKLLEKTEFSRCVSCFFNQQLDFERDLVFNITKIFAHSNHEQRDLLIKFLHDFEEENFTSFDIDVELNDFMLKYARKKRSKEKLKKLNITSLRNKAINVDEISEDDKENILYGKVCGLEKTIEDAKDSYLKLEMNDAEFDDIVTNVSNELNKINTEMNFKINLLKNKIDDKIGILNSLKTEIIDLNLKLQIYPRKLKEKKNKYDVVIDKLSVEQNKNDELKNERQIYEFIKTKLKEEMKESVTKRLSLDNAKTLISNDIMSLNEQLKVIKQEEAPKDKAKRFIDRLQFKAWEIKNFITGKNENLSHGDEFIESFNGIKFNLTELRNKQKELELKLNNISIEISRLNFDLDVRRKEINKIEKEVLTQISSNLELTKSNLERLSSEKLNLESDIKNYKIDMKKLNDEIDKKQKEKERHNREFNDWCQKYSYFGAREIFDDYGR